MASYSLDDLRLAISLIIIGQQLLLASVFLKGRPIVPAQWLGVLLLFGSMCYLVESNPILRQAAAPFRPIVLGLSMAVPYLLWEFSVAIFEIKSVPRSVRYSIYVIPFILWVVLVADINDAAYLYANLDLGHAIVALTAIALTIASIHGNRRDDLLEPRRHYRDFFVLFIGLQTAAVITVEMIYGRANVPDWLELTNVLVIEMLTLGLSLPLLLLDGRILWQEIVRDPGSVGQPSADPLTPANRVLHDALSSAMQNGFYRTQGLGIRELANELNVPEHQLRHLINQKLGYRNFSAFLNHHRISEAKTHLSSAATVRIPVLTVAMDLGYGSIGPFNRAFKETTGITPSEFRRQNIGKSLADSE